MLIAARQSMLTGGVGPTAKSYVQNGLVAMWDGIENAGWGVHDSTPRLIDLMQSYSDQIIARMDSDHGVVESASKYRTMVNTSAVKTIEFLCSIDSTSYAKYGKIWTTQCAGSTQYSGVVNYAGMCIGGKSDYPDQVMLGTTRPPSGFLENPFSAGPYGKPFSVSFSSASKTDIYLNGGFVLKSDVHIEQQQYVYLNGEFGLTYRGFLGGIYNIRLYNRTLSAAEVAANYAVDKIRFNLPE